MADHPHRGHHDRDAIQASSEEAEPRLVHAECRKRLGPELQNAYEPSGLA